MSVSCLIAALLVGMGPHENRNLLTALGNAGFQSIEVRVRLVLDTVLERRPVDQGGIDLDYSVARNELGSQRLRFFCVSIEAFKGEPHHLQRPRRRSSFPRSRRSRGRLCPNGREQRLKGVLALAHAALPQACLTRRSISPFTASRASIARS